MELHGGDIRVESRSGEGAHFVFTMPAADTRSITVTDADVRRLAPVPTGPRTEEPPAGKPDTAINVRSQHSSASALVAGPALIRSLIVDDDPINLRVLRNHLDLQGHNVTEAANGREALGLLDAGHSFDLILLDVMMPGLSGQPHERFSRRPGKRRERLLNETLRSRRTHRARTHHDSSARSRALPE